MALTTAKACLIDMGATFDDALVRALTTLGVSIKARIDSSSPQTISSYPEADFIFAPASMGSLGRAMSALRAWPSRPEPILIAVCRDADSGTLRALEAHDVEHAISVDPLNVASLALLMNGRLRRRASITRGREAIDAAASVVEASTDAIVVIGADQIIRNWNSAAETLFGYRASDAIGRNIASLIVPEAQKQSQSLVHRKLIAGGEPERFESERRNQAGQLIPVEINAVPFRNALGDVLGVSIVYRDISRRKELQSSYLLSEAFARSVLEASPDCLKIVNPDGKLRFMNANGQCLMEISDFDSIKGQPWSELWPAESRSRVEEAVAKALQGASDRFEAFCPTGAGTPKFWDVTVSPILDELGACRAIFSSSRDVTALKQKQFNLEEAELKLRLTLEAADLGAFDYDFRSDSMNIDSAGRANLSRFDLAESMTLRELFDLFDPQDRSGVEDSFAAACDASGDGKIKFEARIAGGEGAARWASFSGQVRFERVDGSRAPISAQGVVRDTTSLREAMDRLHVLSEEMLHRNKNLFAVIQSIIGRSFVGASSMADVRAAISGRLDALARASTSLATGAIKGANLESIVSGELAAFGARARISGEEVAVSQRSAQTFSLLIHELATNAAKHGSLSVDAGAVDIGWRIHDSVGDWVFEFTWRESGGPKVAEPARKGFGQTLITRVVGAEFETVPELKFGDGGFEYSFRAPLARVGRRDGELVRTRLETTFERKVYDVWDTLARGVLPTSIAFKNALGRDFDRLALAELRQSSGGLAFTQLGKPILLAMPSEFDAGVLPDFASHVPEAMKAAYMQAAQRQSPVYETMRIEFGDGAPVDFCRLLLPLSNDRKMCTHVAALALFRGRRADETTEAAVDWLDPATISATIHGARETGA